MFKFSIFCKVKNDFVFVKFRYQFLSMFQDGILRQGLSYKRRARSQKTLKPRPKTLTTHHHLLQNPKTVARHIVLTVMLKIYSTPNSARLAARIYQNLSAKSVVSNATYHIQQT